MALTESKPGKLGWLASDFTLADFDGQQYSLQQLRQSNGLVIAFICNHCPYVKAVIDRFCADAQSLQQQDFGIAAIMSNDWHSYPDDSPDNMRLFARQHGFTFPYLVDQSQQIARDYDAVCTPDFYGFDKKLQLYYRGRLDSLGAATAGDNYDHELLQAMQASTTSEQPAHPQLNSIGCSIKWKH